jgi:hypothetical protein
VLEIWVDCAMDVTGEVGQPLGKVLDVVGGELFRDSRRLVS